MMPSADNRETPLFRSNIPRVFKGFNNVDRGVLLSRLSKMRIIGNISGWIYEFVVGRSTESDGF